MIPSSLRRRPPSAGVLLVVAAALGGTARAQTASYTTLTNNYRSVTNYNVETIRGMAIDTTTGKLWAINTHGSTLEYFTNATGPNPAAAYSTLVNPSAMALYDQPGGGHYVLVVGGGTHGVARHDRNTGLIDNFLTLPSEPMDIVLDLERNVAFVSCGGAYDAITLGTPSIPKKVESGGVVVEIDLLTFTEIRRDFIPNARPMFLDIDKPLGSPTNVVYVSCHLSGNQTTFAGIPNLTTASVDKSVVRRNEPDDDVFTIDASGIVSSYAQNVGTLLTGHKRHPNGEYWMLGTESFNDLYTTEGDNRGRFAENRLAIRDTAGALRFVSLDQVTPQGQKPASFPIDVGFHLSGLAFITSSTSDVVRIVDANGNLVRNVTLPDGAIPRSILVTNEAVWVYAWGKNEIYGFDVTAIVVHGNDTPAVTFRLGTDPLPAAVKRGREIWYDADRSIDDHANPPQVGMVSCNHCHPRGGTDLLGWRLEDGVSDRKDMMVTQSLFSIEDTFPYHWRGERTLSDFNGAFPALLGGKALDTTLRRDGSSELADFEAFIFSLQGAANPREHLDRVIDNSRGLDLLVGTTVIHGDAIAGQNTFHNDTNALLPFDPVTCANCHGAESGSNGLITDDVFTVLPTQFNSDVPHLRQLGHRLLQKIGPANHLTTALGDRPQGGFGLTQDGDDPDIVHFLGSGPFFVTPPGSPFSQMDQIIDTASFVAQFDEGIAPRAHHGVWYDLTAPTMLDANTMLAQANHGDIDLTVILTSAPYSWTMWYDPGTQLFHTMKPGQTGDLALTFANITGAYSAGVKSLFLGVPPGNGYRFAVDPDDDGLAIQLEMAIGTDPYNADSDGDGYPDGYEYDVGNGLQPTVANTRAQVQAADQQDPKILIAQHDHTTGRISKFFVDFSEPVTYTVQVERLTGGVFTPYGPLQIHGALRQHDTLVGQGLFPSNAPGQAEYRLVVTLTDLANRTAVEYLPNSTPNIVARNDVFQTAGIPTLNTFFTTADLTVTPAGAAGSFDLTVAVNGLNASPTGKYVLLQLLQWDSASKAFVRSPVVTATNGRTTPGIDFRDLAGTYEATWGTGGSNPTAPSVPGPFLISAQIAGGVATAQFSLPAASTPVGTACRVIVLGVFNEVVGSPPYATPSFTSLDNRLWQMPMSPASGRSVDFTR